MENGHQTSYIPYLKTEFCWALTKPLFNRSYFLVRISIRNKALGSQFIEVSMMKSSNERKFTQMRRWGAE